MNALFVGTNLISYLKSTHFLFEPRFAKALEVNNVDADDSHSQLPGKFGGTVWNKHVVLAAARNAMAKDGDFVECGTYTGTTAEMVCRYCDLGPSGKRFHLYDLFEHAEGDTHTKLPMHDDDLHASVLKRFEPYPYVNVVKGRVPDVFATTCPDRIAFLHVDMNDPTPELLAFEALFDRMTPGGVIVLDDYGHVGRQDQMMVANAFFQSRNRVVMELPTGQGLVIV